MPKVKKTKRGMLRTFRNDMTPCQMFEKVAFTLLYIESLRKRKCNRIRMATTQMATTK